MLSISITWIVHIQKVRVLSTLQFIQLSSFEIDVHALLLKSLINQLPSKEIFHSNWSHIKNLSLADPNFGQTGPIDLILGAKIYAEIVLADIIKGSPGTPTAQKTELG